jgi:hypothetical protein
LSLFPERIRFTHKIENSNTQNDNNNNQQIEEIKNIMNISATTFALFLGLCVIYEDSISVSSFAPALTLAPSAMNKNNNKASQLNYLWEAESRGFAGLTLGEPLAQNIDNDENIENDENNIDPMEEAFDNMTHPMELMLLNRACIPYVAN